MKEITGMGMGKGAVKRGEYGAGRRVGKVQVGLSGMGALLGLPEGAKVVGAEITVEGVLKLRIEEGSMGVVKYGEKIPVYKPVIEVVDGVRRFKEWGPVCE